MHSSNHSERHFSKMERVMRPSEFAHQQLATLEMIVEKLLQNNTPESPIVKEKIEQVEKIIIETPSSRLLLQMKS